MITCKKCGSDYVVKDGVVRGQQRYLCKACKCRFSPTDRRTNEDIQILKALFTLVTAQNNISYKDLSKIFGRDRSLLHRWYRETESTEWRSRIHKDNIKVNFSCRKEYEEYIGSLKNDFDPSKPLYISSGGLLDGEYSTLVIIQRDSDDE